MIHIDIHHDLTDSKWRELLSIYRGAEGRRVFSDPAFIKQCANFWQNRGVATYLVLGSVDGETRGLLPLRKARLRYRGVYLEALVLVTYPIADVNSILCKEENKSEFIVGATRRLNKLGIPVFLNNMPEGDGRRLQEIANWRKTGQEVNPYYVGKVSTLAEKKHLQYYYRALVERKGGQVSHHEGAAARHLMNDFFDLHIERWAAAGVRSTFLDEEIRLLYKAVLAAELDRGNGAVLTVLEASGKKIAMHFGFYDSRAFLYHIPCFSIDALPMSPGTVLLKSVLDHVVDRGFSEFDFGNGDEWYKSRFANERRLYSNYWLFPGLLDRVRFGLAELAMASSFLQRHKTALAKLRDRDIKSALRLVYAVIRDLLLTRLHWYALTASESHAHAVEVDFEHYVQLWRQSREKPPYLPCNEAQQRFKAGWKLFAVESNAGLSFGWVVAEPEINVAELGARVTLPNGSRVILDCWTSPAARGTGLYKRLLRGISRRHSPDDELIIFAGADNVPSIKGIRGAGARKLGSITRVCGFIYVCEAMAQQGFSCP